jgi:hypothetical protein
MNQLNSLRPKLGFVLCLIGMVAALNVMSLSGCATANARHDKAATAEKAKHLKKMAGADLYALHCNRCHPERYAPERVAAHWTTILTHMRVRANLPAGQAREILEFLQEDSGK